MGGHGGLNILPQKRWNVYGRENRLKVARDEEQYEAEQKEVRDKHEQAEREFRHRILLERARQRYGDPDAVGAGADPPAPLPSAPTPSAAAADVGSRPMEALQAAASNEIDHQVLDSFRRHASQRSERSLERSLEELKATGGARVDDSRKRRREEGWQRREKGQTGGRSGGKAPSLAELAQQLHSAPPSSAGGLEEGAELAHSRDAAAAQIDSRFRTQRLEHVNLFAEEEHKARNPEAEAEKKTERRARGDPKTQTSDAKFDERFKMAYGLTGKEAMPWYAKQEATLPGSTMERIQQGASSHSHPHLSQLAMWRQAGQQALTAAAAADPEVEKKGGGGQGGAGGWGAGAGGYQAEDKRGAAGGLLLGAVKVVGKGLRDAGRRKRKRGQETGSSSEGGTTSDSDSSSSSSGDVDSSSGAGSDVDTSSGSDRRRSKKRRKERRKERSSRKQLKAKKEKHRKKKKKKGRDSKNGEGKGTGGLSLVERLRAERLEREAAEKLRQQRVVRDHGTVARQGEAEGRRYHSGYGFGRPPRRR